MKNFNTDLELIHANGLHEKGVITNGELDNITADIDKRNFSLAGETAAFMSIGALLLTTGLGILIYKNIDRSGHIILIGLLSIAVFLGFRYCFRNAGSFTKDKVESVGVGFDYILLLSNLIFLSLLQYLNFQTNIFGDTGAHYLFGGLFVLFNAYRFDHAGVLSVGITSLAAFFGIRLNAVGLLEHSMVAAAGAGLFFAISLEAASVYLKMKKIKVHFRPTFVQFSLHLFYISLIILLFDNDYWLLLIVPTVIGFIWYYRYSMKRKSFYFAFFNILYTYIAITTFIVKAMIDMHADGSFVFYFSMLYLMGSGAYGIVFIKQLHQKLTNELKS